MKYINATLIILFLLVSEVSFSSNLSGYESRKAETEQVSIFPNPFTRDFSIKFNTLQSGKVSVKVFDIIGNEVLNQTFDLAKSTKEINIEANPEILNSKGIYIVRVVADGNTHSFRIFKN